MLGNPSEDSEGDAMTSKELRAGMVGVSLTAAFFCAAGSVMYLHTPDEPAAALVGLLYALFAAFVLFGFVFCLTRPEKKEESNMRI